MQNLKLTEKKRLMKLDRKKKVLKIESMKVSLSDGEVTETDMAVCTNVGWHIQMSTMTMAFEYVVMAVINGTIYKYSKTPILY